MKQARAMRNPDVLPNLSFLDFGGHSYGLLTATFDQLSTEFVCIPRPLERSDQPVGDPLAYPVEHRTSLWKDGETPKLKQEVLEGKPAVLHLSFCCVLHSNQFGQGF